MHRRTLRLAILYAFFATGQSAARAQEFKLFDRDVQVHGFASQAFVKTDVNNWLTMDTSDGSCAFTDFGVNLSTHITDRMFVGAQGYDRNLGQLGQYHPSLDWAVVDYRFKNWLGVRGGKVKTVLGLYNATQDQDFLRPFALLPQSVIPPIYETPPSPTLAAMFTATFRSSAISAVLLIRFMRGTAVTAFIADIHTCCRSSGRAFPASAVYSMAPISDGALRLRAFCWGLHGSIRTRRTKARA